MFDIRKVKEDCIQWIRDWFQENGDGCNAIVGISGGKDSSIVAALCVEALGKDRVIGVMMPKTNEYNDDIKYGEMLINHLGITSMTVKIKDIYDDFKQKLSYALFRKGDYNGISEQARINLSPRIRMTTLYAIAQTYNGRVANTCNLSEDWIGYSTRYGDTAGDFSPLSDLTTDEVIAIGDYLNLPYELVHRTPADGLCGKTDEDNFGFSYAALNRYIRTGKCEDPVLKEKIDNLHKKNMFKLLPMPKFEYKE